MILNNTKVVILQHPQEKKISLATVPLVKELLKNVEIKIGLSWKNFKSALGINADPARWVVLYAGSRENLKKVSEEKKVRQFLGEFLMLDRSGNVMDVESSRDLGEIQGILLLDGSWKQAKTLWWRNPWMLKLKRAVIVPDQMSLYGNRRKEPRPECLSTIESIGIALSEVEGRPEIKEELNHVFKAFLARELD